MESEDKAKAKGPACSTGAVSEEQLELLEPPHGVTPPAGMGQRGDKNGSEVTPAAEAAGLQLAGREGSGAGLCLPPGTGAALHRGHSRVEFPGRSLEQAGSPLDKPKPSSGLSIRSPPGSCQVTPVQPSHGAGAAAPELPRQGRHLLGHP